MALNPKQKAFAVEYIVDFHATDAAIRAGYNPKSAYSQGSRLLKNDEIQEEISIYIESIAVGRHERLKLLSEIARGGEKDSDRLSAIEKLGKLAGDYVNKTELTGKDGDAIVFNVTVNDD